MRERVALVTVDGNCTLFRLVAEQAMATGLALKPPAVLTQYPEQIPYFRDCHRKAKRSTIAAPRRAAVLLRAGSTGPF